MPIQLPPISRRQFIARTLGVGAGLSFSRTLRAADKPVEPNAWALLADPHIAADREKVSRGVNMAKNLAAVGREVLDWPKVPAAVLLNGDCAFNTGETGDYAAFTALLDPLREAQMPIHLTLGNHDDRNHFWEAVRESKPASRPVEDRHVGILRSERANWFLLDTLEKTNGTPGLLGEAQLQWLAKGLDANADKPAIIFAHHNLEKGEVKSGLKDTEKLLALLEPRKQVKAYIFGHTHNWSVTQGDSGLHLVNLPPVGYVFKDGNPNGWVHAQLSQEGMRLELRCLDRQHKDHGQAMELKWRAS